MLIGILINYVPRRAYQQYLVYGGFQKALIISQQDHNSVTPHVKLYLRNHSRNQQISLQINMKKFLNPYLLINI
jgi:hypothetical protein